MLKPYVNLLKDAEWFPPLDGTIDSLALHNESFIPIPSSWFPNYLMEMI